MKKITQAALSFIDFGLLNSDLSFQTGPFIFRLSCNLPELSPLLRLLYADYLLLQQSAFADFYLSVKQHGLFRRFWRSQVQFWIDDKAPFEPYPRDTALPFLEWGLNWCVATHAHHYLMLHAGVVEKNHQALILPAWPGSGKSTLAAALCQRGWRLLSDEFGLVRPKDGLLLSS